MKRVLPVLFFVLAIGIWFGYRRLHRPVIDAPLSLIGSAVTGKERSLAEEMDISLDVRSLVSAKSPSPMCQASWLATLDQKQSTWLDMTEKTGQFHTPECVPGEWETLRRQVLKTEAACGGDRRDCRAQLVIYRAKLVDGLTTDLHNYLDMPLSLLISKAYAQTMLDPTDTPKPLNDLLAMVDAISSRRPGWFPGRKLAIVVLFQREQSETDDELKSQVSARLDREIEAALAAVHDDPIVREIDRRRQDQEEEPVDMAQPFLPPSILNW